MASRHRYGPGTNPFRVPAPALPTTPGAAVPSDALKDVSVGLAHFRLEGGKAIAGVSFPAYDATTHRRILALHAVVIPRDLKRPADASELLTAGHPSATADVSANQSGTTSTLAVDFTAIPTGTVCTLQVIVEDETPDAPPASTATDPTPPAADPGTATDATAPASGDAAQATAPTAPTVNPTPASPDASTATAPAVNPTPAPADPTATATPDAPAAPAATGQAG